MKSRWRSSTSCSSASRRSAAAWTEEIVGTGPDFNLRKKHLGHPTINPKWTACGKNEFPLGHFPFSHLVNSLKNDKPSSVARQRDGSSRFAFGKAILN
jgi:hypothetical protein